MTNSLTQPLFLRPIREWWAEHTHGSWLAWFAGGVAACLFIAWESLLGGLRTSNWYLNGNSGLLYATSATIFGALLGFAIASVSIVAGLVARDSQAMAYVRGSSQYPRLWRVFISATRLLAIATILALIGLIVDTNPSKLTAAQLIWLRGFFLLVTVTTVLRVRTAIWLLGQLVGTP